MVCYWIFDALKLVNAHGKVHAQITSADEIDQLGVVYR